MDIVTKKISVFHFGLLSKIIIALCLIVHLGGCKKEPTPEFFISKSRLVFNPTSTSELVKLSFNPPDAKVNWEAQYPYWISISEDNGTNLGTPTFLTINVVESFKNSSYLEGEVVFSADNGQIKKIKVIYSFKPIASNEMKISRDTFSLNSNSSIYTFKIYNSGDTNFNWNLNSSKTYIDFAPSTGVLQKGDSTTITLNFDKSKVPLGKIFELDSSFITNNFGEKIYIKHSIFNFEDKKFNLSIQITDAIFNKNTNEILAIDNFNNQLHKIDPFSKTIKSTNLPISPNCIAFNNSDKVAIGANGKVLIYDFITMGLEKTITISKEAFDIVYGSNNWIYVTPNQDQWENILCINPTTSIVTEQTGNSIYEGMYAVAHPSKPRFYLSDTRLSPTDIERMDITSGTAISDGDSPYHGDHPINGELYITQDGKHIISGSGKVFSSNDNKANDMLYAGALSNSGSSWGIQFSAIEHNLSSRKIYAAKIDNGSGFSDPKYTLQLFQYSDDFFTASKSYDLTQFMVNIGGSSQLIKAYAFKVFCNSSGSKIIICSKSASSGLSKYAIEVIDP